MESLREMILTKQEPVERLKEFVDLIKGRSACKHTLFTNGIFCELFLYPGTGSGVIPLHEARFVKTTNIDFAEKVLASIALEKLGLSSDDIEENLESLNEENLIDEKLQGTLQNLSKLAMNTLSNLTADMTTDDTQNDENYKKFYNANFGENFEKNIESLFKE